MKTKLITLLIAITAIVGSASAQEYDRVIELYKGGEVIQKYKLPEVDSIKFNKEYKYAVSATISPANSGTVAINGTEGKQYISAGETATFVATPKSGYQFKNWSISGIVIGTAQSYTTTISADLTLTANFEEQTIPVDPYNGHEYVDLGLPSGIKWATCNVGATTPEGYGDYFAWGETSPKTTYNWSTYKYCNGSSTTMTKYCTDSYYGIVDNKTTLELTDDAAHVNWGGAWRMPTLTEQEELLNTSNCAWTWTTQNGVKGYKVTSKVNGNSIFLPAAGYRIGGNLDYAGSYGEYWSSSLYTSGSYYAYGVYSSSSYVGWGNDYRFYGRSVRAVCE
ncbi:MAG: hypothetical protein IKV14_03075 [Muribaculaceae bacterium]|nr:hypothetical protein [Muribaculaceae bacterium]